MSSMAPAAADSADDVTPVEQRAPQQRLALAGTFDRLVQSNLELSESVRSLVSTIYVAMGFSGVAMIIVAAIVLTR